MKKICIIYFAFCLFCTMSTVAQQSDIEKFQAKKKSEQHFNSGVNALNRGQYSEAVKYFTESIKISPASDKAYLQRAKAYFELKDLNNALPDLNKAIEINNSNGEAYFCSGLYKLLTDTASAQVEFFDKAITNGFSQAYVYYYRAVLKKYKNNLQGSLTDFSVAIEKNPTYMAAFYDRGIVKSLLGDHQGAILDFRQVLSLDSTKLEVINNIANAKINLKDFAGAIAELDKLIRKKKDHVSLTNRGTAYVYKDDLQKAHEDYRAALSLKPDYDKAYVGMGNLLMKQKKYPESIEQYNKAIQLNAQNAEAYLNRGSAKEMTGDLDGACADWKSAAGINRQIADYTGECN